MRVTFPEGKYKTIYIDPPWPEYGGGKIKRGANAHYRLMSVKEILDLPVGRLADEDGNITDCLTLEITDWELLDEAATALETLQAKNEKLRADLTRVTAERDAAKEAVKNMAEYIVCVGRVDYILCDEISQEHHLKYQPKNDGNYDNEPCYRCVADWFLQGHKYGED